MWHAHTSYFVCSIDKRARPGQFVLPQQDRQDPPLQHHRARGLWRKLNIRGLRGRWLRETLPGQIARHQDAVRGAQRCSLAPLPPRPLLLHIACAHKPQRQLPVRHVTSESAQSQVTLQVEIAPQRQRDPLHRLLLVRVHRRELPHRRRLRGVQALLCPTAHLCQLLRGWFSRAGVRRRRQSSGRGEVVPVGQHSDPRLARLYLLAREGQCPQAGDSRGDPAGLWRV